MNPASFVLSVSMDRFVAMELSSVHSVLGTDTLYIDVSSELSEGFGHKLYSFDHPLVVLFLEEKSRRLLVILYALIGQSL